MLVLNPFSERTWLLFNEIVKGEVERIVLVSPDRMALPKSCPQEVYVMALLRGQGNYLSQ